MSRTTSLAAGAPAGPLDRTHPEVPVDKDDVTYFSGGARCSAWYYPVRGAGPAPAVVFCPGYTGTKFASFYQPYVERLTAEGIAVLLLDYRGWGESEGPRGVIDPLAQVADIRAGLTYLETRPEVDRAALGVVGVSFGGGHATYVAGVDRRVKAAVSISGVADGAAFLRASRREYEWGELLAELDEYRRELVATGASREVSPMGDIVIPTPERRTTAVKGDVPAGMTPDRTPLECADLIMDYRPVDVVPRISGAMLWLYVEGDVVVPPEHSLSMYTAAKEPRRLVALRGGSHYAAYVDHFPTIADEMTSWLTTWLRG
jgi:dipeptidyl aminopeptidase/acylaminoacyl peptidase